MGASTFPAITVLTARAVMTNLRAVASREVETRDRLFATWVRTMLLTWRTCILTEGRTSRLIIVQFGYGYVSARAFWRSAAPSMVDAAAIAKYNPLHE